MGIYCNLHITIEEIYKFVFLHVEYLFFFPWNLSCIFSFAVMWFGLFFLNEMRRKRIFSTHVWRERKRKTSRLLYRCISLVFSTRGTLFLRPYYLSVLSLSFELQSDNVNWNSCIHLQFIYESFHIHYVVSNSVYSNLFPDALLGSTYNTVSCVGCSS